MKIKKEQLKLYAITDRSWLGKKTLAGQVKIALENGVTCIQLREKHLDRQTFLEEAKEILLLCREKHIPLILNDTVELVKESGADGVHIGQKDMPLREARAFLGTDKIIGTSAHTVKEAIEAQENGADYIGVGAVFGSSTKTDAIPLVYNELVMICQAVTIPVVAIGGINEGNVIHLRGSGIDGIAVISAIFAQEDIGKAARKMRRLAEEIITV